MATGYYKNPGKTAEDFVLHEDGNVWFHTGKEALLYRGVPLGRGSWKRVL